MDMGLEKFILRDLAERALAEDLGRAGDITTRAVVREGKRASATLVAHKAGRFAGIEIAAAVFAALDNEITIRPLCAEGGEMKAGMALARIEGDARAILTGERAALNFLNHISGIATSAAALVEKIGSHKARLCCTRKTRPGLRLVEKYGHRAGGGVNHRFGLDDGVLIKDNHIALAGSIAKAVADARTAAGHLLRIEVEVESQAQLDEALKAGADAVLLDNIKAEALGNYVRAIGGRAIVEASGNITPETLEAVAASGVDLISTSWTINHPAPVDIGLDIKD